MWFVFKMVMKKYIVIVIFLLITIVLGSIISLLKFDTLNFLESGFALYQVNNTNTEIVQINESPDIFIVNPKTSAYDLLMKYMNERNYEFDEPSSVASTLVFINNDSTKYVDFSVNKFYSKWKIENNE